ncbi:MAG TPA: toxin TcdB middle/C-terminal domain-containing protein, partial [Terrimicrobiaceae bacterium]|nr:toxin TcdB middle/C-terminal domain-containing protein [Terrimicrobiaceae bacterium]
EVYALDGTDTEDRPYSVIEQNYTLELLQPSAGQRNTVFFAHPRESIDYQFERKLYDVGTRKLADPRVTHTVTLEVDAFGNVLKSAAIGYGRRHDEPDLTTADQQKQKRIHVTLTENLFTNLINEPDDYRTPLPCEARTYELLKANPVDPPDLPIPEVTNLFRFDKLSEVIATVGEGNHDLPYGDWDIDEKTLLAPRRRLIEHVRTLYHRNDLAGALPLGGLQSLALPFESYKLAFTPELLAEVYGERLTNAMLESEGRYVHSEDDAGWWIPAGRIFFSPDSADTPAQELALARQHFFLPRRFRDPFHTNTVSTENFVGYDAFDLMMVESRDALGNVVTVATQDDTGNTEIRIDYRVLQPYWVTDPNGNRTAVTFDALGMVVGTAVMGRPPPAPVEGDSLDLFETDLTEAAIIDHLQNPLADPQGILRRATTRLVYDLFAYFRTKDHPDPRPVVVYTLARETHDSDPVPAGELKIQHSFSYSDGFGREIQRKIQAEPGRAPRRDANGRVIVGEDGQPEMTPEEITPRWVGSGWTIFNNKGKPVRQYEPFFTDSHRFEFDVRIGVSPVLFYDPVGRVVATLYSNHTWEKVAFDPWGQETWDVNDTVMVADPKTDPDVGEFFRRLPEGDYLPTWHALRTDPVHATTFATRYPDPTARANETQAAEKTRVHAETPAVTYLDSLGRTF